MNDHEPLHIGMNFNVMNMLVGINVIHDSLPISVNELTGVRDTPTMAGMLKERYPKRTITIYPDASCQSLGASVANVFQIFPCSGVDLMPSGFTDSILPDA